MEKAMTTRHEKICKLKMVPLVGHAAALPTDACAAVIDESLMQLRGLASVYVYKSPVGVFPKQGRHKKRRTKKFSSLDCWCVRSHPG
jgi:hypothetical protein